MNVENILKTIDRSQMERAYVDFHEMCEKEFEIYEYLTQTQVPLRLTYCYYHTWMCTDTYVGIRAWYFDGEPVCISYKPYRKSNEKFYWINKESFENVFKYAISLKMDEEPPTFKTVESIPDIVSEAESIDHKKFESKNIKT